MQNDAASASNGADEASAAQGLDELDRHIRGRLSQLTGGQSLWAALQAWEDWQIHLAASPGRQLQLGLQWGGELADICRMSLWPGSAPAAGPDPHDRRFRAQGWRNWPYSLLAQGQLALERQWRRATTGVRGVSKHHSQRVQFMGEFLLNAVAPVNSVFSNPEIADAFFRTGGGNFVAGARLMAEDLARVSSGYRLAGLDHWQVGTNMAVTPGRIVFRNELFELIQYAPSTEKVYAEPVLIVPAWIMKYYILDLTSEDSLVRYLVDQGFTVFVISWKNPDRNMRETHFETYRSQGVMTAIDAVAAEVPHQKIHGVGYCLGGTLLAVTAAAMNRDDDLRMASLTLLAAQIDFEEAGELLLFIDESQLSLLEDMMHVSGYLDARRMAGAFYALRANELLFAKIVERYLLGRPSQPTALDAWLADPTRMPARMHSEYLRQFFMEDRFAHGKYEVDGKAIALKDVRAPIFALGAERDHIAPWRSVYKTELYKSGETTFILTGGGHNSSVVSPPGKVGAYYWKSVSPAGGDYVDPDTWLAASPRQEGSWWPFWRDWLVQRSGKKVPARLPRKRKAGDEPLGEAPGVYVYEP